MALTVAGMPERKSIVLPAETIEKLLDSNDKNAAPLYLFLCLKDCGIKTRELCSCLRITDKELESARAELLRLGLLFDDGGDGEGSEDSETRERDIEAVKLRNGSPVYSKEEIIALKNDDKAFAQIIREASQVIKPLLTESDLREIMTIYSYFGLPADCFIMLIHFTAARAARQSDGTRRPSLLTVKKEAFRWLDRGITTARKADEFMREETRILGIVEEMEKAAGLPVYSNDDMRLLRSWAELGYRGEAVKIAADISKEKLGEIKLVYMGRIIKNWKSENLTDPADIMRAEKLRKREREMALTARARRHPGSKPISASSKKMTADEIETLKKLGFDFNDKGGDE